MRPRVVRQWQLQACTRNQAGGIFPIGLQAEVGSSAPRVRARTPPG